MVIRLALPEILGGGFFTPKMLLSCQKEQMLITAKGVCASLSFVTTLLVPPPQKNMYISSLSDEIIWYCYKISEENCESLRKEL